MRWRIYEAIARQDTVLTGSPDPVVSGMIVSIQVKEFHPSITTNYVGGSSFLTVTPMVMSYCAKVFKPE
jgi:hypothetical protein